MYRLQKVLTGIKRSQMPPKLNRHPITIQILDSIYSYFQPPLSYNADHIMLWAAFTLAFFVFFYVQANLLVIAVVLTLLSISV